MAHHPRSIERYLDDFCMVASGYAHDKYSALRLSRTLRLSERLVDEYIALYRRFAADSECKLRLEQLLARIDELYSRTQKNTRRGV